MKKTSCTKIVKKTKSLGTISMSSVEALKLKNLRKNKSTCWMCDGLR